MRDKKKTLILSLISLGIFILILIFVVSGKISVDYLISSSVSKTHSPSVNWFFIFLGNYAGKIMILIAIILGVTLYSKKRRIQSFVFLLTLVSGYILGSLIKFAVKKERPLIQLIQETGYSFPSQHSVFSVILFSMLIYFYKDEFKSKAEKAVFIFAGVLLIFLVGLSRIYLNVHWFSDIIGGYALGFFLVCLCVLLPDIGLNNKVQIHPTLLRCRGLSALFKKS